MRITLASQITGTRIHKCKASSFKGVLETATTTSLSEYFGQVYYVPIEAIHHLSRNHKVLREPMWKD